MAQFRAGTGAGHQGQRPEKGRHCGHEDGAKAKQAGLIDGVLRRQALVALRIQGKVDHHDGVLLHDADEKDDADDPDDSQIAAHEHQGKQGPDSGRRQGREDGDGMDEALVENTQDDIHGQDRGQDEEQLISERGLEGEGRALETGEDAVRHAQGAFRPADGGDGFAERASMGNIEGDGVGRKLAEVIDEQRFVAHLHLGEGRKRHLAARSRRDVDLVKGVRGPLQGGIGFHDHPVLVRLGEDGGNDPLAKGVVERVVNRGRGDAKTGGGVAVDHEVGGQALLGQIGRDIGQLGKLLQAARQGRGPFRQIVRVGAFEHELELGAADPILDRQVLNRLEISRNRLDAGSLRLQAPDDFRGGGFALIARLEIDHHPAGVEGGVAPVDPDEGRQALHVRILQHRRGQRLLPGRHRTIRGGLRRFRDRLDQAGVLHREKSLGDHGVKDDGQDQGADRDPQGQGLMAEHPAQAPAVLRNQGVEPAGRFPAPRRLGRRRAMPDELGAHHRHQGQRDHRRDQNRHRQSDGKFPEKPPDHVAHEQERDQDGDQGNGQGDDGETDLLRALQGRLQRAVALLHVTGDILDHDDGIVHDEAGGDRQGHEREIVQAEAEQIHDGESADEGERNREAGNDGGGDVAQKNEDDQDDQNHRQGELALDIADRGPDGVGPVGQDIEVDRGREGTAQDRKEPADALHHLDDVGPGLALDIEDDRRGGADPGGQLGVFRRVLHRGHIGQPDRGAVAIGDDQAAVLLRGHELVVVVDGIGAGGAVEAAFCRIHISITDCGPEVVDIEPVGGEGPGIDPDAHRLPSVRRRC